MWKNERDHLEVLANPWGSEHWGSKGDRCQRQQVQADFPSISWQLAALRMGQGDNLRIIYGVLLEWLRTYRIVLNG